MEIRIDRIVPFYEQDMGLVTADVRFSVPMDPPHPASWRHHIDVTLQLPGDPHETFVAFETRVLQTAYTVLARVLADRQMRCPRQQP